MLQASKKLLFKALVGLQTFMLIALMNSTCQAFEDFDLSDLSIDLPIDANEEQLQQEIHEEINKTCPTDGGLRLIDIVTILTGPPLFLQNILPSDFYHKTYPPIIRSLHNQPTLMPLFENNCWSLSANAFYNQTTKQYFTSCSSAIGSYLNLSPSEDFLEQIDIDDFTTIDIPDVLSTLRGMTLQERRLGAMLQFWGSVSNWLLSAAMPFYYIEHNFFLNQKEIDRLQNQALFSGVGTKLPGLNLDTFTKNNLVSDRAGIGDLRLQVLYNLSIRPEWLVYFGGQLTFPTAHTFKRNINGGDNICKKHDFPLIDYKRMFDLFDCAKSQNDKRAQVDLSELVVGYGIDAIDRLTANVADRSLGQQHFSFGPTWFLEQPITGCTHLLFQGECSYVAPGHELRYFKIFKNKQEFIRDYSSEELAQENLLFLEEQSSNTLYPTLAHIKVRPGPIVEFNSAFVHNWQEFTGMIGYDFWAQAGEHIHPLASRCTCLSMLDIASGTQHAAYEGKLFGLIGVCFENDTYNMRVLLRGDTTIHHKGIGSSITVGLNLIFDF